ncbi:hypothetical protein GBAR_LOCUS15990 [Geodia barretti]|uniref:Fibronectin type-III domain-containing protein n=1 Tax=Geodia barretti TaxID=519541 RepID=A0AA35SG91_GEOBA|nr:hypothetical protein GBAR_LOCUS15990 [Geodia barretti]
MSAVTGVSTISNASSVTILWSAPFSLDVTGVDPDIWYSVLIYNVTDENNPTAILCTDCINITETHYTFTPDYLSPCHVYNFSVIPLNGAGQGESSPNITIGSYEGLLSSELISKLFVMMLQLLIIFFEVFTAAGPVNVSHDTFTTYDVHSLLVEEGGGGVLVRGEFMSGSRATGCLVVLQGPPSSPDIFRALLRTQSQDTVSTTVPVPPSTYTVYGYDLEENGLPNTMPAVVLESQILMNSEVYPEASCLLVYREYGSPLLTVVELSKLINFPVSITVDNPENYTFALFGKNGATSLDEEPLVCTKFSDSAGLQTRNVVYDEVALSPTTTSSSVILTEPNTAYVTTTIPTDQNVAYAVHSSS